MRTTLLKLQFRGVVFIDVTYHHPDDSRDVFRFPSLSPDLRDDLDSLAGSSDICRLFVRDVYLPSILSRWHAELLVLSVYRTLKPRLPVHGHSAVDSLLERLSASLEGAMSYSAEHHSLSPDSSDDARDFVFHRRAVIYDIAREFILAFRPWWRHPVLDLRRWSIRIPLWSSLCA